MGRYFGLVNQTKHHHVSSYWKSSPPCPDEVREIAGQLGWDLAGDVIESSAYDTYCKWVNNEWEYVDLLELMYKEAVESEAREASGGTVEPADEEVRVEPTRYGWDGKLISEGTFDGTYFCN